MQRVRVRWSLTLGLAVAALGAGVVVSPAALGQTSSPSAAPQTIFSGAAARQQVEALGGQIGSRPAGSPAYDQAVGYASDQLRQAGYQPRLQTFPVQIYVDRGSRVEVVSGAGVESLEADTLGYSIAGDVQAPLIAAGLGQSSDFDGLDARDRVVLIKRGTLRFSDKVANAAAAGARAVIVYNDSPGRVQGSLVQPEAIPAVTVSAESGQRLLDLLAGGPPSVHLAVDAATEQSQSTNVLAELPADRAGAGTVVFGGHLDSVSAGPGANDNGSGSAVVVELARELAQRPPGQRPLNVRFALFGAEELGLYGSRAYVDALPDAERQSILAMVNLDMVGVGDIWRFGGTEDLVQRALGSAADLGARSASMRGSLAGASDHASFLAAGIPSVFLYRAEDPNYHTAGDRPELVDPVALGQAGTIALSILDGLGSEHQ